jgi:hypothetical protein
MEPHTSCPQRLESVLDQAQSLCGVPDDRVLVPVPEMLGPC